MEWESWDENANHVADYTLQNRIVKIHVVLNQLLVAVNPNVRRTMGFIAPNARWKIEKFRSRIWLSESCSRWEKRGATQDASVSQGTCGKKRCLQLPSAPSKSTKQIGQERGFRCRAGEIIVFFWKHMSTKASGTPSGAPPTSPDTVLLIIRIEETQERSTSHVIITQGSATKHWNRASERIWSS